MPPAFPLAQPSGQPASEAPHAACDAGGLLAFSNAFFFQEFKVAVSTAVMGDHQEALGFGLLLLCGIISGLFTQMMVFSDWAWEVAS